MRVMDDPKRTVIEPRKDSGNETVYEVDLRTGAGELPAPVIRSKS